METIICTVQNCCLYLLGLGDVTVYFIQQKGRPSGRAEPNFWAVRDAAGRLLAALEGEGQLRKCGHRPRNYYGSAATSLL